MRQRPPATRTPLSAHCPSSMRGVSRRSVAAVRGSVRSPVPRRSPIIPPASVQLQTMRFVVLPLNLQVPIAPLYLGFSFLPPERRADGQQTLLEFDRFQHADEAVLPRLRHALDCRAEFACARYRRDGDKRAVVTVLDDVVLRRRALFARRARRLIGLLLLLVWGGRFFHVCFSFFGAQLFFPVRLCASGVLGVG